MPSIDTDPFITAMVELADRVENPITSITDSITFEASESTAEATDKMEVVARWWAALITEYQSLGILPEFITMEPTPDYHPNGRLDEWASVGWCGIAHDPHVSVAFSEYRFAFSWSLAAAPDSRTHWVRAVPTSACSVIDACGTRLPAPAPKKTLWSAASKARRLTITPTTRSGRGDLHWTADTGEEGYWSDDLVAFLGFVESHRRYWGTPTLSHTFKPKIPRKKMRAVPPSERPQWRDDLPWNLGVVGFFGTVPSMMFTAMAIFAAKAGHYPLWALLVGGIDLLYVAGILTFLVGFIGCRIDAVKKGHEGLWEGLVTGLVVAIFAGMAMYVFGVGVLKIFL